MKIFLIGLMGSGKSFWAKKLSTILNIPTFDLDAEIEILEGKTVAAIFASEGENYFRQVENKALKNFEHKNNFVLATGGGAACFHDNIEWMNKNGITIWIDDSPEIIVERLKKEKAHRPLIASISDEGLKDFLIAMREKRKAFYSQATYCLTGTFTETDFLKIIVAYE